MNVILYHYDWDAGRNDREQHFNITFMPKYEAVQAAWKNKLYSKVLEMSARDDADHLELCEDLFHAENSNERLNHRSMSVGDIVKIKSKFYLCASIGFREIKLE